MAVLLKDYEEKVFKDEASAIERLEARKATDKWYTNYINENQVIGLANAPIVADSIIKDLEKLGKVTSDDESFKEAMADSQFALKYATLDGYQVAPVRFTALPSIRERAKLSGQSITNKDEKQYVQVLSPERKGEILSEMLSLYSAPCKILVRDEKVSAMPSDAYVILNSYDLAQIFKSKIKKELGDAEFAGGIETHEFVRLNYVIKNEKITEGIRKVFKEIGLPNAETASVALSLVTSDVGNASATCVPYIVTDSITLRMQEAISMPHLTGASLEKWGEKLESVGELIKDVENKLDELAKINIKNAGGCFRNIACTIGLPKDATLKVAEEFELFYEGGATALDVFYYLFQVLENHAESLKSAPTAGWRLKMEGQVATALLLDFKQKDVPFEWKER